MIYRYSSCSYLKSTNENVIGEHIRILTCYSDDLYVNDSRYHLATHLYQLFFSSIHVSVTRFLSIRRRHEYMFLLKERKRKPVDLKNMNHMKFS